MTDKLALMTGRWLKITAVYRWLNHAIDFSQAISHLLPGTIQAILGPVELCGLNFVQPKRVLSISLF